MARKRMIDPEFWLDEEVATLSPHARLLYIGIWSLCDDINATFPDRPDWVKAQVFPYEQVKVDELFQEIQKLGKIIRFEKEGKGYWYIKNFNKWQRVEKPSKERKYPRFLLPVGEESGSTTQPLPDKEKRREEKRSKDNITTTLTTTEAESASGKEVNLLIESFKDVNPSYEQLFRRKNQREACQRLLKKHGAEKIGRVIAVLPATNAMQYAPVITSPLQLEEKLGKILAFISKEKLKVENKEVRVAKI